MQQPQSQGQAQQASVLVSNLQRGNPILKCLRQVAWRYGDIEPDFIVGAAAAALYISVQYHLLHPNYLKGRLASLSGKFRVRVLLVHVDVDDSQSALHALTKLAFVEKWSMVCAWSRLEVARYIETFKLYENKPADLIQGRTDDDYTSKLTSCLTAVRLVNKTDVATLASTFGSLKEVMTAPSHEIKLCPGIGELKATRLADTFREPFLSKSKQPAAGASPAASWRSSPALAAALQAYAQLGAVAEPALLRPGAAYESRAGANVRIDFRPPAGAVTTVAAAAAEAALLRTGAASHFACVVVGGDAGLSAWKSLAQSLPPDAPAFVQPSGFLVLLFQADPAFSAAKLELAPGLEIHGEGGLIVAPSSHCPQFDGQPPFKYTWEAGHVLGDGGPAAGELRPPPPPSWLVDAARQCQ